MEFEYLRIAAEMNEGPLTNSQIQFLTKVDNMIHHSVGINHREGHLVSRQTIALALMVHAMLPDVAGRISQS